MIARIWRASATTEGAKRYREHFTETVLADLERLDGFEGALLLQRDRDGQTDIQVITRWTSLEHIRDFAGSHIDTAVVGPAARAVLADYDATVTHYTVTVHTVAP
jgi:heme-degrading monooxygenase HmoA